MQTNRIDQTFKNLRKQNKKALIPYITAGYPDLATTRALIKKFASVGVDIIEIGIPFSDPIADGPVIQMASESALKNGIALKNIIRMVKELRESIDLPIIFMTYYNPIFAYCIEKFVQHATKAGIDGIIVPDLPPEEADEMVKISKKHLLDVIFLATPTSSKERIQIISKKSTGFIYYVSVTGVTGERQLFPKKIIEEIHLIKNISSKPVCVGFGISTQKQAGEVASYCDGVIVGSAIVKKIQENISSESLVENVTQFVQKMLEAVKRKK
jgi:tryptophan synthase alpha chain